jgi:hypothetical protein
MGSRFMMARFSAAGFALAAAVVAPAAPALARSSAATTRPSSPRWSAMRISALGDPTYPHHVIGGEAGSDVKLTGRCSRGSQPGGACGSMLTGNSCKAS